MFVRLAVAVRTVLCRLKLATLQSVGPNWNAVCIREMSVVCIWSVLSSIFNFISKNTLIVMCSLQGEMRHSLSFYPGETV